MKEEILERIRAVLNALNLVYVRGKENLANQYAAIDCLETVMRTLAKTEITVPKEDGGKGE